MKPVTFNGINTTLRGNGDTIADLPVYTDGLACVSAWELSDEEIAYLVKHRKVYLTVFHPPNKFPPVGLTVDNPLPTFIIGESKIIKP